MNTFDRKNHWENIYKTKSLESCSWYEPIPEISLNLIQKSLNSLNAKIIDIGGGDSFLAENLIDGGYKKVEVLDISSNAIERAQKRLGDKSKLIEWTVSDILDFDGKNTIDFWHDRAAFHFLREEKDIEKYVDILNNSIAPGGYVCIGTFSKNGPLKCSGIEIKQYNVSDLQVLIKEHFDLIESFYYEHSTPFDTKQEFCFALFRRK